MIETLPIVGVMGSGNHEYIELAEPLGAWLAEQSVHLLTGGGAGVMTSVSRAFSNVDKRKGRVIGILPGKAGTAHPGYPNPWIEIPVYTHLPLSGTRGVGLMSRNHINVLSSDVIIALPGGEGTASEIQLAIRYAKPVLLYTNKIPVELAKKISAVTQLEKVKAFVLDHLSLT